MNLPSAHPLVTGKTTNSALVRSYLGEKTETKAIWLMRQAGRSLPEYRKLREGVAMLDSCLRPDLAAEITLQPIRRHKVDAAIFFSDIVVPLKLAGVDVEIAPGIGPLIDKPIRTRADFARLEELDPNSMGPIREAIQLIIAELGETPLIGFGGAPFTLASYLIEGGPSKELPVSRAMMANDPDLWNDILAWTARVTATFIRGQVLAGASALQLFDSWAGRLGLEDYRKFAAPHSKNVMAALEDLPVSRVHFGVHTRELLVDMYGVGATVMGVDYETPLDEANRILGGTVPLQGNINPGFMFKPWDELEAHVRDVLERGKSAPGHVVNLGHGVPPETDPDVITKMVALVHGEI
ncbi:uroporphyrinogen decarboxylase [Rhodoluna lacicola]|uniref:Uroporphyrinogen decarboxylase n=1 Tax=Rhodoluna lacicola TaxID=529884 RepID=A0A060JKJ6_9MICO|nr:uroporphyrinogen decarboxylase [Rhodoluna lacicola]AIC47113.1 uroporphyrinogen decarboxylase [Rhodoluna lacicola]